MVPMTEEKDQTKKRSLEDIAWGAGFGFLMLLISGVFTVGLVLEFAPAHWSLLDTGFAIALLGVTLSLAVACLASLSHRPFWQRIAESGSTFAILLFAVFMTGVWFRSLITDEEPPPRGTVTFGVMMLLNCFIGLLLYLSGRRDAKKSPSKGKDVLSSPVVIVFWPVLLFFKSPVGALLYLAVAAGVAYLGEWIGAKHGHPLLGSLCSTGSVVVVLGTAILIGVLKRRRA
jgi:hypothetical protein